VYSITPGFGADVKNGITNARSFTEEDLIVPDQAERKSIYKWIQSVGVIESNFPTDSRNSKCISVVCNTSDHSSEQRSVSTPILGMVQRTETQTIHRSDGASAHRKDVAQDSPDSGGRTLKRFDE
jgi:hypothetical protein